jgi:hypothetical protein
MTAATGLQASVPALLELIDLVSEGSQSQANAVFKEIKAESPSLAYCIAADDFLFPCSACSGTGYYSRRCPKCDGTGNASVLAGGKLACTRCKKGSVKHECSLCSGSGAAINQDALRFLSARIRRYAGEGETAAMCWERAKTDMQQKRKAFLRSKRISGPIAQIADGGVFIIHYDGGRQVREMIVGMALDDLYENKLVTCEAWPVGPYTYTSVLGASITIQKFTIDFWGDW